MTRSSQAGKRRGKSSSAKGSSVSSKGAPGKHGGLGINRSASKPMELDGRKSLGRAGADAPNVEPSTRGAKRWTSGRAKTGKGSKGSKGS